jgi:cytochrome c oxidase subunit II
MRRGANRLCGCAAAAGAVPLAACGGAQSALQPYGPHASSIATLWWIMLALSIIVLAAIFVLLGFALWRRREAPTDEQLPAPADVDVAERDPRALSPGAARHLVVWGGAGVPGILLFVLLVYSVVVGRQIAEPAPADAIEIDVIGRQFWWDIVYRSDDPSRQFRTANEIRIPVGQPVRIRLRSADVIHSFWVPNLHGKIDMVPRRDNEIVIQADSAGVFRGQCAEFCGVQHALMALYVVAKPASEYDAWRAAQLLPAQVPTEPARVEGARVFQAAGCGNCHAVRGTRALAAAGPDLTHFGSRLSIGAATLPNRRGHLAAWIADPQRIKPGNFMPSLPLRGDELGALVAYLEGLH